MNKIYRIIIGILFIANMVCVYDHVLLAQDITERYQKSEISKTKSSEWLLKGIALKDPGYNVRVKCNGAMQIEVGSDRHNLTSMLSYPGKSIGWVPENSPVNQAGI